MLSCREPRRLPGAGPSMARAAPTHWVLRQDEVVPEVLLDSEFEA